MKKLLILLLLPLLLLTACSGEKSTQILRCSREGNETDYSTIEWTKETITEVTTVVYDDEEIAASNEDTFKTDKTITSLQRDGKVILITRAGENKGTKSIENAKTKYEKEGFQCEIEDAK